jgi:murein DD-endopeptidase MepM/ murein hydrolase activator NlpD
MVLAALCVVLPSAHAGTLSLDGSFVQGGLVQGTTDPGTRVSFDGAAVRVGADGGFLIGFGRDAKPTAALVAQFPDGAVETRTLKIETRTYAIQRIEGLPPAQVSPSPEDLARIRAEDAAIKSARKRYVDAAWYRTGFEWPALGPISGVYGSQRILNGEPRAPHLGTDIAAPEGTEVHAPAPGLVAFARPNLFFTGNTIILDHGRGLFTLYAHLSAMTVREGDTVAKGAVIGRVGKTGRVTGAHLHWAAYLGETRIDAALLVPPMPSASAGGSTATAPAAPGSNPR